MPPEKMKTSSLKSAEVYISMNRENRGKGRGKEILTDIVSLFVRSREVCIRCEDEFSEKSDAFVMLKGRR